MKDLICYFSASGLTRKIAQKISEELNADIFEIEPKTQYSEADLDWQNSNSRSSLEMKRLVKNPEIIDKPLNINNYNRVFVGFPIWWYEAPTIIHTFFKKYSMNNKKIILFASSGMSLFGETKKILSDIVDPSNDIIEGKVFHNYKEKDIKKWLDEVEEI